MEARHDQNQQRSMSVAGLRHWARAFRRLGLPDERLTAMGVVPDAAPEARITALRLARLLEELGAAANKPHVGVELARAMPMGVLGSIDYRWSASATLFESMLRS